MTKKYKYIEYEKLSDAVRDWEDGKIVYVYLNDSLTWGAYVVGDFKSSFRYAKRVEIKEKTVEAWAVVNRNAEIVALSPDGRFKGEALPPHSLLKVIKLTGII